MTAPAYRERDLTPALLAALRAMPVVVVTGMRQVGKSTLLRRQPQLAGRRYVSLDDFAQLEAARRAPEAFLGGTGPVTVDEVQKCPELLPVIKRMVDEDRTPGRFLLSGSANFALLRDITESLAGRAVYLTLSPFTRREISGRVEAEPYLRRFFRTLELPREEAEVAPVTASDVFRGGMPPVCLDPGTDPALWFRGYEQTYLERDVRQLTQVADLITFRQFVQLAALRTGQILNVSELARDARIAPTTAGRYLGVLEASFVVRRLPPYLKSRASRLIKSSKIYITDSGLACHLAGIGTAGALERDPLWGALFETHAAAEITAILESRWPEARLSFWHVQGRHEVDFIVEAGREVMAIELKAATRWTERDLSGLRAFLHATPNCRAAVLAHNGTAAVKLGDRLWALPLGLLLS